MAATIQKVRPGDLITADLMNTLIDEVLSLRKRVEDLESTGVSSPVDIVSLGGSLRVNEIIEVHGTGFSTPPELNTVRVGTTQVENFVSVSATLLRFYIPPVVGAPKNVTLSVANQRGGSDTFDFYVLERLVRPTGRLILAEDPTNAALGTILVGSPYTLKVTATSETTDPEQYILQVAFTNVVGASAAAWAASAKIVDSVGTELSVAPAAGATTVQTTQSRKLDPGAPVSFGVRLTVPAGATSASIVFGATSVNNPNTAELQITPVSMSLQVGAAPKPSDDRVKFARSAFGPFSTVRPVSEGGVEILGIPYNGSGQIGFSLSFQDRDTKPVAGTYQYDAVMEPAGASPWVIDKSMLTSSAAQNGGTKLIGVTLTLNASAAAGGAHPEARTLLVTATRTGTPADPVESFVRLPVRGYTPTS